MLKVPEEEEKYQMTGDFAAGAGTTRESLHKNFVVKSNLTSSLNNINPASMMGPEFGSSMLSNLH